MESEKVKEIKKALEERIQHKPINCYNGEYVEACGMYCRFHRKFVADMGIKNGQACENCNKFTATNKVKEYAEILTLINELESENERLSNALEDNVTAYKDGFQDGASLKGRIENKWVKENQKLKNRIAELEKEIEENAFYSKGYAQGIKNTYEVVIPDKLKQFTEKVAKRLINIKGIKEILDETLKEFLGEDKQNECTNI